MLTPRGLIASRCFAADVERAGGDPCDGSDRGRGDDLCRRGDGARDARGADVSRRGHDA